MTQRDVRQCTPGQRCRYSANQYGAYYTFCNRHYKLAHYYAATEGKTPEQWLNSVVLKYINDVKEAAGGSS